MSLLEYEAEKIFNKILVLGLCDCEGKIDTSIIGTLISNFKAILKIEDNRPVVIEKNLKSLKSHINQLLPYLEKDETVLLPLFVRLMPEYISGIKENFDELSKIKAFKFGASNKSGARSLVLFTNKRVLIGHEETSLIFLKKWHFEEISYENMEVKDSHGIVLKTNKGGLRIERIEVDHSFSLEKKWQNNLWVKNLAIKSKIICIIHDRIFNSPEFEEVTDENHEEYFRIRDILRKNRPYVISANKENRARRYYYRVLSDSQREELRLKVCKETDGYFWEYYDRPEDFVPDIMFEDLPDYFDL